MLDMESNPPPKLLVDQLYILCRRELRRDARRLMRRERRGHTLGPTDLLDEAYLILARAQTLAIQDTQHFRYLMIRRMNLVLIDDANRKQCRLAMKVVGLDDYQRIETAELRPEHPSLLAAALDRLRESGPAGERRAAMVEYVFFVDSNRGRAALHFGVSVRQLQRELRGTLAWLELELRKS